tara:strand:- start:1011 stop:2411 length:1401 start_codon:yes stop_codon:yes gene_type:complete
MKKFFLFRRSDPVGPVKRVSDNGKDISVIAIPADKIAFITAGKGEVNITFNSAGIYEDSELFTGDSIEKTNVSISCEEGSEVKLIEKIVIFSTREGGKNIMKFDAVDKTATFDDVLVDNVSNIKAKIKSQPTERITQKISTGNAATRFLNVIGEINFGSRENRPFVDYNHESMYPVDNTDIVAVAAAEWKNAGTGGAAYDITGGTGSVTTQTESTAAAVGLGQICAQFASNSFLDVPDITIKDDYTMYFVIGDAGSGSGSDGFGVLFGDDNGETTGFSSASFPDEFTMRHDGLNGKPFKVRTLDKSAGTEAYQFPDRSSVSNIGERQFCYVFVIRRDKEFNMYLYNFEGELVAFVPAFTVRSTSRKTTKETRINLNRINVNTVRSSYDPSSLSRDRDSKKIIKVTEGTPGRTDGNLLIQQLGSAGGNVTNSFSNTLARFGIINRDTGDAFCSQLAQDLYDLYKPTV